MATGLVELVGTQIGSTGSSGHDYTKLIDGDFATFAATTAADGAYWGIDAGAAVTVRTVKFAPRRGDSSSATSNDYENRIMGAVIQSADDSAFTVNLTTEDTLPGPTGRYQSLRWNTRTLATPSTRRYWRYLSPAGSNGYLAALRFVADAGVSSAKPVLPVVSANPGWCSLSGSATVTMSSLTTSAAIYYTTDGSTPDNTKTLYAAPFTLTIGGGVTLKAVAYDASLSTPLSDVFSVPFRSSGYLPNDTWYDNNGDIVNNAGSGGILRDAGGYPKLVDGYYWWYGTNLNAYVDIPHSLFGTQGVHAYKTRDFLNFIRVGFLYDTPSGVFAIGSPKTLYNAANNNYVMWSHAIFVAAAGGLNYYTVASAPAPDGPWTIVHASLDVSGVGDTTGDHDVYTAASGIAYLVYSNVANGVKIVQLNSAFTDVTGSLVTVTSGRLDGLVLAERADGQFVLFGTALNDTDSTSEMGPVLALCSTALGSWGGFGIAMYPDPLGTNYNGQFRFAMRIGANLMLGSDFWVYANLADSRQVWLPYDDTLNSGTGLVVQTSPWDLVSRFGFVPSTSGSTGGVSRSRMQLGM